MKRVGWLLLCSLLICACGREHKKQDLTPVKVSTQVIDTITVVAVHTYMGELEDKNSFAVSSSIVGKVKQVLVHNNEKVIKGQVLIELDNTQQLNTLQTARASLLQAEDGYARAKKMYDNKGIAEVKLIEVETQLNQARSLVAIAEKELQNCTITAQQDGIVTELKCQTGQIVIPGEVLMRLIGNQQMAANISIPEKDISSIHIGDKATAEIPVYKNTTMECRVTEISLIPNRLSHTYDVKLILTDKSDIVLLPGMVCRVQLSSDMRKGFMVPASCIQMQKGGLYLWVVENGEAHRREISEVEYAKNAVLVGKGLNKGDIVVVEGFQKLYNNAKISTL